MTKNTTFLKLIQTVLTDDDIYEIAEEIGIKDLSNKVNLWAVTEYMIMAACSISSACRSIIAISSFLDSCSRDMNRTSFRSSILKSLPRSYG